MALGDYILCCKCECKLIYDGDRNQRTWWEERFGKEPEIECPNCKTSPRQPLTDERTAFEAHWYSFYHSGSVSARSDGSYFHPHVQRAWEAWQARAAQE